MPVAKLDENLGERDRSTNIDAKKAGARESHLPFSYWKIQFVNKNCEDKLVRSKQAKPAIPLVAPEYSFCARLNRMTPKCYPIQIDANGALLGFDSVINHATSF